MRRVSLLYTNNNTSPYTGNEPITLKVSDKYGSEVFTWNTRFNVLMDDFFKGLVIHNLTDTTHDIIEKYVQYADNELLVGDKEYGLIEQFDSYLATLKDIKG